MLMVLFVFCVRMPQLAKKEYIAERTLTFFYDPIMDAATGSVSQVGQTECRELDQKRMALKKASQKSMRVVLSADLRK